MTATVWFNIGELTTNDPTVGDESPYGRLRDAALLFEDDRIAWVGPSVLAPDADTGVDCEGAAVIPGFVDSHTHLVFGGDRADEFSARMSGDRYDGGGILRTVAATREASRDELVATATRRRGELLAHGVTTVEVKSGYDLTTAGERRLLEVACQFTHDTTWLGAHALAPEFADDRDGYVQFLITDMLAHCRDVARWCDVFCDDGAFSVEEARTILEAGRAVGLGLRVHGNQITHGGGVQLAVALDAASVDHCTHLDAADIDVLATGSTVATLLPTADFLTRSPAAPGRALIDAGAVVALATDCNPGTSYVTSMALVMSLAVGLCGLTPDEALWSATAGGARALQRVDVGALTVGARADMILLAAPTSSHLVYRPGADIVARVLHSSGVTRS